MRTGTPEFGAVGIAILLLVILVPLGSVSGLPSNASSAARPTAAIPNVPPAPDTIVAPAFVPSATQTPVGALSPNASLQVAVAIASQDPAGFSALTDLMYTPGSPEYHHFLSATSVANRFGALATEYSTVVAYFESFGLHVTTSPDRMLLFLTGPSAAFSKAFDTTFEVYAQGEQTFYTHPIPASLPSRLDTAGVFGLSNETDFRPMSDDLQGPFSPVTPTAACSGSGSLLIPCQLQNAYNSTPLLAAGSTGRGITIGVVDNYDSEEPQPQLALDLADFDSAFGLTAPPLNFLYPVPTSLNLNATPSSLWGVEEALDLQWSHAMAPGATIDMTFAPNPSIGLYEAVDFLVAHQSVNVLTMSWGEPDVGVFNAYDTACSSACNASTDGSYGILSPVLAAAAAEGITVFAASGDCGSADGTSGVSTNYPASDPFVTGVGGTVLQVSDSGAYEAETAWEGNSTGAVSPGCTNQGGSGGGYAPFPAPWWQEGPGVVRSIPYRGVPDVSADAATPVEVYYHSVSISVGGTSLSSPLWAGFAALGVQYAGENLGSLSPQLYSILRSPTYDRIFHDVTAGSNGAYSAGVGWDPVTGIGTPNVGQLVPLLGSYSPPVNRFLVGLTGTPRYAPAPATVVFQVQTSGGVAPYPLIDVSFGDGDGGIASGGSVAHTYGTPGVYPAEAVAFDATGNLSFSIPLVLVIGGGGALNVSLIPSTHTPATNASVTWTVTARGGAPPYSYAYWFGDGTFLNWSDQASVIHTYSSAEGACAIAAVKDSGTPPNGSGSGRVAIEVGGASTPDCFDNVSPLNATVTPEISSVDAPGDLQFEVHATGGAPPYSLQYASTDPYVSACECGIFRAAGTYPVEAFVNDSLGDGTTAWTNVTIYPPITATFTVSTQSGPAPLSTTFSVNAVGGHALNPASTIWRFGDNSTGSGASVDHTYEFPGRYLAIAQLSDGTEGNASEAFLIDVLPSSNAGTSGVVATIAPAVYTSAGAPVYFNASAEHPMGPVSFLWNLGANDSAYGANVTQTYSDTGCLGNGTCPLAVTLSYRGANGTWEPITMTLSHPIANRWSALTLSEQLSDPTGVVPWRIHATASTSGIADASVSWQFGTGAQEIGSSVSFVYASAGEFTLADLATDRFGDELVRTHAVTVTPAEPPIEVHLLADPLEGSLPLAVRFAANATGGNGGPYTYAWNFADGSRGNGSSVDHTFTTPGTFPVELNVTDSVGTTNDSTVNVLVTFAPAANAGELGGLIPATLAIAVAFAIPWAMRRKDPPSTPDPPATP